MAFLRLQNKIWHIIYLDDGKRKSFTTKTEKKNLALGMLKSFNAQRTLKLPFEIYKPVEKIIFSVALEDFLSLRENEKTKSNYRQAFKRFTLLFDDREVNLYSSDDFTKFYRILKKDGLSQNTIAHYSSHLSIIFNWLVEKKYIKDNPVPFVNHEKKEVNPVPLWHYDLIRRHYFIRGQFKQFDLFSLIFLCALRITEAINVCGEDFDISGQTVHIRNSKGKRIDSIPMTRDIEEHLSQMDLHQGRLFDYASKDSVKSTWKTVNRFYGFEGNTIHGLRKARSSQLANAGVTALFHQTFMRHRDYRTTQRAYTKVNLDIMRKEINEKLEKN